MGCNCGKKKTVTEKAPQPMWRKMAAKRKKKPDDGKS